MPNLSPIQAVEAFHLAFLRVLESKLRRDAFVVKGGINLRAWFASLRYHLGVQGHAPFRRGERQKIGALAGRRETQARDIWDLDHLLRTTRADPRPLPARTRDALPGALERVTELPFEAFKAQVVSFLAPEHQDVFGSRDAWQRMQELVIDRLLELRE